MNSLFVNPGSPDRINASLVCKADLANADGLRRFDRTELRGNDDGMTARAPRMLTKPKRYCVAKRNKKIFQIEAKVCAAHFATAGVTQA
jgi:hypothetical protein